MITIKNKNKLFKEITLYIEMGRRKTMDDYKKINIDEKRKINFIGGSIPKRAMISVENGWKCMKKNCGYIWSACYNSIYNTKSGCPNCGGNRRKTMDDYKKINMDEERKINFIGGSIPKNACTSAKNGWKCMVEN